MSDYKPATWTGLEMHLNAEITRLRAINAELLEALEWIAEDGATDARATECAREAIAKAKETT